MSVPASEHLPDPPDCSLERRRHVRYRLVPNAPMRFLAQPGFQFREGLLQDVSAAGLCLIVDEVLPVGARLIVQLPGRRHGSSLSRAARVLRVEAEGPERWRVGCRLSSVLSPEELTALQSTAVVR